MTRSADGPASLEEFASTLATERPSQCITCNLDAHVREEIETARVRDPKRFSQAVIAKYLRAKHGVDVTESSVKRHFANHV